MYSTESEPCEAKLQSQRDPDHTVRGVGPDGVFCCPECGARLRLEGGAEFEGEGRATLPGLPSSSSALETRSAETPEVAEHAPEHAAAQRDHQAYLGARSIHDVELPSLIDDPADLAPADTDEPTRVTRTNGLVELPPLPVLPPPPPLVPEEMARRASLGLPLPVLPPPPVAPSVHGAASEETRGASPESETESETDGELEDIDRLLSSQPSQAANVHSTEAAPNAPPAHQVATEQAPTWTSPIATPVEKRPKHPLPVPHPVWVNVPLRRDALSTPVAGTLHEPAAPVQHEPLAAIPAVQELQNPATLPEAQTVPTPPEAHAAAVPEAYATAAHAAAAVPEAHAGPAMPEVDAAAAHAAAAVPAAHATAAHAGPAIPEAQTPPTLPPEVTGALGHLSDQQHVRPLFSEAPLTRDTAPAAPRKRSSRALWLSLLVVGGGALVLQQRIKSSETALSSPASPVVSVVLAAQPAPSAAMPNPAEPSPAVDETATKSPQPEPKLPRLAARIETVKPKAARSSEQDSEHDSGDDAEKAKTAEEPTFDADAAAEALEGAAANASSCRQASDPSGVAVVTITFAPSGRVTTATIAGPPFVGTATGSCIAATLRRAKVPPFKGKLVTVRKTVTIH